MINHGNIRGKAQRNTRACSIRSAPFRTLPAVIALIWMGATTTQAATLTVPGSSSTIQGAITLAAPGDTINVAAGTYNEQLTIGKNNLTIVGAAGTIIKPTSVSANTSSPCSGSAAAAIILVQDGTTGVTLQNLLVDGSGAGASGPPRYTGIFYRNASGAVSGGEVRFIEDIPFSGVQRGVGILVQASTGGSPSVNVNGVSVHDFQKGGIVYNGCGCSSAVAGASTGTVSGNTVTGVGATSAIAQNGIQVGFGAGPVTISSNTVSAVEYTGDPANGISSGILLYSTNSNPVTNNTVTAAQDGIVLQAGACSGDGVSSNTISGNTVTGNVGNAGTFYAGFDIEGDNNSVTMNAVADYHNGDTGGIFLYGSGNSVTCNETSLNDIGIETLKPSAGTGVNTIHNNSIHGNTAGLRNDNDGSLATPVLVIDASSNYWGKFDGPGGSGPGTGDSVSVDVTFSPFLSSVPACVSCDADADCNNANACDGVETCSTTTHHCVAGTVVTCTALDQCHVVGTCNTTTGVCTNPPATDGASCSDGNGCTLNDTCQGGVCQPGPGKVCAALDQCHVVGTCNTTTGVCSNPAKPNGTACNDGNACTVLDQCLGGQCIGVSADHQGTCDDHNPCTDDSCNPAVVGGCVHINNTASCSDGNACTANDRCSGGQCVGGAAVNCDDHNPCTADACSASSGCAHTALADGTQCSDGTGNPASCFTGTCCSPALAGVAGVDTGSLNFVEQQCPSCPRNGTTHLKYVKCVKTATKYMRRNRAITTKQQNAINKAVQKASVGQ